MQGTGGVLQKFGCSEDHWLGRDYFVSILNYNIQGLQCLECAIIEDLLVSILIRPEFDTIHNLQVMLSYTFLRELREVISSILHNTLT